MKKLTILFMAAILLIGVTQASEAQQFKWKLQSTSRPVPRTSTC